MKRNSPFRHTTLLLALLAVTTSLGADTVNVTTADDVVGGLGTSLREAFDIANSDAGDTTIVLEAGTTYELDLCGAYDDANASGDLDHTEAHELTIEGNGATIRQTCEGDRVLHNLASGSLVILNNVTITGGEVALTDFGGGVWMDNGDLEVSGSTIIDNYAGESGGGIQMDSGHLTVLNSVIENNRSGLPGGGIEFSSGTHSLVIEDSVFDLNEGDPGGAIAVGSTPFLSIARTTFTGNEGAWGAAVFIGQVDEALIVDCAFELNDASGGSVITYMDSRDPDGSEANIVLERCTVAQNTVGTAAIEISTDDRALLLVNSTVSGNSGVGVYMDDEGILDTRHSTIVSNTGHNVEATMFGELRTFATIIANVEGPGSSDCAIMIGADSDGYNFSGDGTCGLGLGAGDVSFGGDPKLAALAYNSGLTRSHAPYSDSPVIDHVPLVATTAALGAGPVDQRAFARPSGPACEVGSYEGHLIVPQEGSFTIGGGGGRPPVRPVEDLTVVIQEPIVEKLRDVLRIPVIPPVPPKPIPDPVGPKTLER